MSYFGAKHSRKKYSQEVQLERQERQRHDPVQEVRDDLHRRRLAGVIYQCPHDCPKPVCVVARVVANVP